MTGTRCARGFTLLELMVAVVLALVMSLAIFSALASSEGRKRSMTSVNDISQTGNVAAYQIEKALRGAGSGFAQSGAATYGCKIMANDSANGVILPFPPPATMQPPFQGLGAALSGIFRLAPVVIVKGGTTPAVSGNGSDALIIMAGNAGYGEVPIPFNNAATASQLNLLNSLSLGGGDVVLVTDKAGSGGPAPCMIEQVSPLFSNGGNTPLVPLAGRYTANPIGASNLTTFSASAAVLNLGNAVTSPPGFQILGVGDDNVLYGYDLLHNAASNTSQALADGVFEMHALYGVDNDLDGRVDTWMAPDAPGYDFLTLEYGTAAANLTLQKIKAIRIGLILRTSQPERAAVTPGPLTLFADLGAGLSVARALAPAEQSYRYRTIDITVPLRNAFLLNKP